MNESDDMEVLTKCMEDILEKKEVDPSCEEKLAENSAYKNLYDSLLEIRTAITDIGEGKLDTQIKSRGYFSSVVKQLQSTLMHLVWQTKVISSGNFSQSVDFLGEFSEAFNTMTERVEENINKIARLETQSRETKEHFEAIFNTSPDVTVITDMNGKVLEANEAFFKLLGYSKEEVINKNYTDIGFLKEGKKSSDVINQVKENGECKNLELVFITKDREEISVLNKSKIISLKDKHHTLSVSRDITKLKAAQDAIKQTELQYERMLDKLPFSVTIVTPDGFVLYANERSYEMFHIREEIINTRAIQRVWEDLDQRKEWIKCIKKDGFVKAFDARMKTLDGRKIHTMCSGFFFKYQNQDCILSTQVDITDRKKMEEELRESEEKYRLLTEFTSDVVWVLNLDLRKFTYVSPAVFNLRGITPAEAMEESLEETLFSETIDYEMEALKNNYQEFLKDPSLSNSYTHELQQPHKDGSIVWVETSTKYRYNAKGQVEIVGASRNIDKRKKSENKVLYLSYHDQLTGLYNRRYYEDKLISIDNERNLPISLIMSDVNGLKLTNDAFGHFAGDELLKKVAEVFERTARKGDIVARTGGDEFVMLLPKTTFDQAKEIVRNIKEGFSKEKVDNILVSASLGCATKKGIDDYMTDVYSRAEGMMYQNKLNESASVRSKTMELIIENIYRKDPNAKKHSENVRDICKRIGQALGENKATVESLGLAGFMHDIGKVGIDEKVLAKVGKLDDEDWIEMKRHPEIGYQILRSTNNFSHIANCVLCHHEYIDGNGYPRGISGDDISIGGKIIAIADSYDSMVSNCASSEMLSEDEAIEEIIRNAGSQFDEKISRVFVEKILGKAWKLN